MTNSLPLPDGEPGWQTFAGAVRVRTHAAGSVQLQVSTDRGDGTFDVATLVLNGALRDVRRSSTQFPTYSAPGLEEFPTAGDRLAGDVLAAQSNVRVTSPGVQPPVRGGTSG